MIVDAVRHVYGLLADGSTGLNASLSGTPADVGDSALPSVTLAHAFATSHVARGTLEPNQVTATPRVDVLPTLEGVALPSPTTAGVSVDVVLRYAVRNDDTAEGLRWAWQTLRTAARVLVAPYTDATFADITRSSNVVLFDAPSIRLIPLMDQAGDDLVLASLVATYPIVDRWVLGAT